MRYFLLLGSLCCLLFSAVAGAEQLTVEQGEVRLPMPGRTVTAGYFSLHNGTATSVELVGATSPLFSKIELHQHITQDGMMRMVEVESITLDADATVVLQPGGLHLMLFEPSQPLLEGQKVPVTLLFADQSLLQIELPLTAMPRR